MTTRARRPSIGGAVPVGRRVLFADRRRGALTVAGAAAALLLVLVLDAIFAGALARVTAYIRTSPADVFVSQAGVRTMHMSASALPPGAPARVAEVSGVAWVRFMRRLPRGPGSIAGGAAESMLRRSSHVATQHSQLGKGRQARETSITPDTARTPPTTMLTDRDSPSSSTPKVAPKTGTRLLKITVREGPSTWTAR